MEGEVKKRRGRPRLLENWTAELLHERARGYFNKCDSRTKTEVTKDGVVVVPHPAPYSIEGLCVFLGILRHEFSQWRKRSDDLGRAANLVHQQIMANRVEGALDGNQNSSFAQFMLKNNAPEDYRDKVEVENTISQEAAGIFTAWSAQWKEMKVDGGK